MRGQFGTIVEFNHFDSLGWIELDEGGRVRFGGTSLRGGWDACFSVGRRVEVRGTKPGYRGVLKAVEVVPLVTPGAAEDAWLGLTDETQELSVVDFRKAFDALRRRDAWDTVYEKLQISGPLKIFEGFAPADEAFAACLEKHLTPLESMGIVRVWSQRRIEPGVDREMETNARIEDADIILLLISADFLASHACVQIAQVALERSAESRTSVVPILIRAADWELTSLARMRALPTNRVPIASSPNPDEAWLDVVQGIRASIEKLASSKETLVDALVRISKPRPATPNPSPATGTNEPARAAPKAVLTYVKESPVRLTTAESGILTRYLQDSWPEVVDLPLYVDDGYGMGTADGRLVVGRGRLYEELACRKLHEKARARRSRELCALYYPSATPSPALLFQTALYFDEVFVIHPGSSLSGSRIHRHQQQFIDQQFIERLSRFDQAVFPLKEASILHCVPPQMHQHLDFIKLITSDLDDPTFVSMVSKSEQEPVFVAARKMEPLLPLLGEVDDVDSIRRNLHGRINSRRDYDAKGELFADGMYGVRKVAPVLAASILLNHAFLTAERYSLIPVTDDPVMSRLFQQKIARISAQKEFIDFQREIQIKAASLAMRAIEEHLPYFEFDNFDHLLAARERLAEPLLSFRQAMLALAAEVDESPYDQIFHKRIEDILHAKIRPAVETLKREIERSRDSFAVKFLRNVQAGALPIVGLVLAGLPPSAVIALGAGVLTAQAAVETYRDKKAVKRNGFSLLLGEACRSK